MFRVGKLTHKVYGEDVDISSIEECCVCCWEDEIEKTVEYVKSNDDCSECRGCPEYWREGAVKETAINDDASLL